MNLKMLDAEPIGPDVVARLEETLEEARKGKISSVAIAIVYRDGTVSHSWSKVPSLSTLIGSIARMQHALIREAEGE